MAMSKKDWFRIVTHMIVTKDKGRRIVVNERFDPTGGSVHECKVYCTALDGRTCKETQEGPNGQIYDLGEYPVDEMLEIELTCLFGSDLRVRDENGKLWELYMDGKFCKRDNQLSKKQLETIFYGDWSGIDPRTVEEDPMGKLSDYE